MIAEKTWRWLGIGVSGAFLATVITVSLIAGNQGTANKAAPYEHITPAPYDASASPEAVPVAARVVVDAGHGGFDAGASGTETGIREDVLNLSVAKLLQNQLASAGIEMIMTR